MKHVISISLGSSTRDKTVQTVFLGEEFTISRQGVDGDEKRFMQRLAELDGSVDAFGFGGMDRYLYVGDKRYEFTAAKRLLAPATKTPVVDGSGLKNTLERAVVRRLAAEGIVDFAHSKTLMVAGVDRFGMSEALAEQGGEIVFGDLMFSLGLPIPIHGAKLHRLVAGLLLPLIVQMPLSVLYPMGEKQNKIIPAHQQWYAWADIIAGDFHYIRRHLPTPESGILKGKTILTNTTTEQDQVELRERGVKRLITTTPSFDGRSFGTNVMEAMCVALNDGKLLDRAGYEAVLAKLSWDINIIDLQTPRGGSSK